jgi:hypothetical protein
VQVAVGIAVAELLPLPALLLLHTRRIDSCIRRLPVPHRRAARLRAARSMEGQLVQLAGELQDPSVEVVNRGKVRLVAALDQAGAGEVEVVDLVESLVPSVEHAQRFTIMGVEAVQLGVALV